MMLLSLVFFQPKGSTCLPTRKCPCTILSRTNADHSSSLALPASADTSWGSDCSRTSIDSPLPCHVSNQASSQKARLSTQKSAGEEIPRSCFLNVLLWEVIRSRGMRSHGNYWDLTKNRVEVYVLMPLGNGYRVDQQSADACFGRKLRFKCIGEDLKLKFPTKP